MLEKPAQGFVATFAGEPDPLISARLEGLFRAARADDDKFASRDSGRARQHVEFLAWH